MFIQTLVYNCTYERLVQLKFFYIREGKLIFFVDPLKLWDQGIEDMHLLNEVVESIAFFSYSKIDIYFSIVGKVHHQQKNSKGVKLYFDV